MSQDNTRRVISYRINETTVVTKFGEQSFMGEISGPHGAEYEDGCLLGWWVV
jgi:hypothetical protein